MGLRTLVHRAAEWNVWDVRPTLSKRTSSAIGIATALAAGWLVFEHMGEKRRLAPIPEGWEDLPEDELRAYLDRAEVVRQAKKDEAG